MSEQLDLTQARIAQLVSHYAARQFVILSTRPHVASIPTHLWVNAAFM